MIAQIDQFDGEIFALFCYLVDPELVFFIAASFTGRTDDDADERER